VMTMMLRLLAPVLSTSLLVAPTVADLLNESRPFAVFPADTFETLGWDLPDGGRAVKALADAAPGSAFDPAQLERATGLGYRASWHVVRYRYYGIDWDITGLKLTPDKPDPALPTIAIVHGGSANWYEFFVDPLNRAGLGQYLAQRAPVLLMTIPGNYRTGGWTERTFDRRAPGYVLDREIGADEARLRNAIFTFSLAAEGVRQLLEKATTGPLLLVGHSTGGEFQFLLKSSSLRSRLRDRSLGWGTGSPAFVTKELDEAAGERSQRVEQYGRYPRVDTLRARDARGYVSSAYVGPLNPIRGATPLEVAEGWFAAENRRRPQFKQVLQDMEHQGFVEHRPRLEREIRETLNGNTLGVDPNAVIKDLFSTMTPPLDGYAKMAWVVGKLDNGHWDARPEEAREYQLAERFRQANPSSAIRVLAIDAPLTHYGHIERPRQLAAVLLEAAHWVSAP
jgi:pimeloyl-ACP methyl ester carboxylesterase